MIEGRDFAAAATLGCRERQEDDWGTHVDPPALEGRAALLAVVADGMGGMPASDQASGLAVHAFMDSYSIAQKPAGDRLRHALAHANREVGIAIESAPELAGMGCTLIAGLFFLDRCEWLSVGDSFILLFRKGRVQRINPLHTLAARLDASVKRGEMPKECALAHPDRAALTSVVQGGPMEEVASGELYLEPGDLMILASDGIATLPEREIASICCQLRTEDAKRIADALVARVDALGVGGQDNATVIVVRRAADEEPTVAIRRGREVGEALGDAGKRAKAVEEACC